MFGPDGKHNVVEDQVVQLFESRFSSAKLNMTGTDFKPVAKLMYCMTTFEQFCSIFTPFVTDSYPIEEVGPTYAGPIQTKSKFGQCYSDNKLHTWCLSY
ncbi:unnamed protein product [Phytophthora fragariaefolia]|uniref:Unnamed protein product n=1 Tax=Phytophthora fragariaefolia TaxID=1490495 RepID=A0A9W6YCE5_9STRA|nr:unnamed protein product [Phytophthora fragariaefolia]